MPAVDRRLLRHTRSTRAMMLLSVVIGTAQAALILLQAALLARIIAEAFLGGLDLDGLRGPLAVLAATLLGRAALAWVAEVVAQRCSAAVKSELRMRFLDKIVALGPRWLTGERSGELTTLATRGIDALDDYFSRYLPQLVLVGIVPLVVAARMLAADWLSAVIVVVTLPLIPVFMVLVGLTTKAATARQWETIQTLAHHFLDVLAGIGTLKVFGRSRAQVETIRRLADRQRRTTLATLRIAFLSSLVLEQATPEPGHEPADPTAGLTLRGVTVRGREEAAGPGALDDVSLVIAPGRVTGIVGPSGGGKSTLLGLLLGTVRPDRGQVLAGSIDLADADLERWRQNVAWLSQDPTLFAGTVADNIELGASSDDVAVRRAAQAARVDVPLDLVLGERGAGVSAGQRRRIALARAILRDAPLLLLDEPTESVDPATEQALLESLPAAFAGRTVVLVTHRPALLELCDHVVHLDRTAVAA